ncbi:hypothetical protein [Brevibacillus laterosporus]|uniref:hypothetical protein n=1 Tax=Brevibacillus laterosporus TaxID=1465 RepID=UPI000AC001FD
MNTFHRLTATAAMPLEAVDAKGNVATQKVEMDKYTKIASQWQEKIALMFPKVKDYHKVNLQNYEWSDLITVTLSKNGPGTPSLSIEINKETNQLYRFRLMEPAGVDRDEIIDIKHLLETKRLLQMSKQKRKQLHCCRVCTERKRKTIRSFQFGANLIGMLRVKRFHLLLM